MSTPKELARINIDKQITAGDWDIQDMFGLNRYASLGVAVREFPLETSEADYLLFVDGKAAGVIQAKPEGTPNQLLGKDVMTLDTAMIADIYVSDTDRLKTL